MFQSMSVEPASHSNSTAGLTAKILDPCPLSQLDIPAQPPAQQQ